MRRFGYLADMEVFVAVIEHGSLTAAAVALGTTGSVVSRAIARLETRLGSQLLRRTTRRIGLTHDGEHVLAQARTAFGLFDEAERALSGDGRPLSGRVRLSVPTTYGHYRLPAAIKSYRKRYPGVTVELNITNRNVDLIAEGFDLAIRMGQFPDSGLVARKLEDAAMCLVASPAYIEEHGSPASIEDLNQHVCLPFVMPSTGRVSPWIFRRNGKDIDWEPAAHLHISEDVLGTVSLAEQGVGICQTYEFVARDRIGHGRLTVLLPNLAGRTRPFSILFAPHGRLSPPARALIDVLVERRENLSIQ